MEQNRGFEACSLSLGYAPKSYVTKRLLTAKLEARLDCNEGIVYHSTYQNLLHDPSISNPCQRHHHADSASFCHFLSELDVRQIIKQGSGRTFVAARDDLQIFLQAVASAHNHLSSIYHTNTSGHAPICSPNLIRCCICAAIAEGGRTSTCGSSPSNRS